MVLPDPSWRVKTRPCPFYQQGRCMFSESCNFLHTVSVHVNGEEKEAAGCRTPRSPPQVVVNSPQSVVSSPRSPRTTGLLLALGDLVADTELNTSIAASSGGEGWSESLPTLVNEQGFGQYSQPEPTQGEERFISYEDSDIDSDGNWTAISDYDDETTTSLPVHEFIAETTDEIVHTSLTSPRQATQHTDWTTSPDHDVINFTNRHSVASTSGLLSPIEVSSLRLGSFFQMRNSLSGGSNSFDSGYADTWKPPIPMLSSPPRSPSVSSTFDLLSSPFVAQSTRISSPRLGVFMSRSPASPAGTAFPYNTEDVEPLDLGLDSPTERQNHLPPGRVNDEDNPFSPDEGDQHPQGILTPGSVTAILERETTPPDNDAQDTQNMVTPASLTAILDREDNTFSPNGVDDHLTKDMIDVAQGEECELYGDTSVWDSEDRETAVYLGDALEAAVQEDVNVAVARTSATPTAFLNASIDFRDGEELGHSSIVGVEANDSSLMSDAGDDYASMSTEAPLTSPNDDTAYLAYLKSPLAVDSTENDTLDSLYSSYSGVSFENEQPPLSATQAPTPLSPSHLNSSTRSSSSTPLSSLRERVFTPPPPSRKRSGTITADSPNSLSSPITSLASSMGRESPFSDKSHETRSQSPFAQDIEVSRKIPIGFRSSFALGRASRSSLLTNRNSAKTITMSPLQLHAEVAGSETDGMGLNPAVPASSLPKGLKPLRLSTIIDAKYPSRPDNHSRQSSLSLNSAHSSRSGNTNHKSISSSSVSSTNSNPLSDNHLLSSARSSSLPLHIRNSLISSGTLPGSPSAKFAEALADLNEPPQSAPVASWRRSINFSRPSSRLSEPIYEHEDDDFDDDTARVSSDPFGETIRRPIPHAPHTAPVTRAPSALQHPVYAIETPKPTLMFAIASDNVEQVRQVLASGEAGPNEAVGPQSALEFTLTNDKLTNKLEIVKALLAYGADPAVATKATILPPSDAQEGDNAEPSRNLLQEVDPATKYFIERAESLHTRRMSVLIQRSFFRPLTRVRYDLIGQDRALEQLFRVLSMHSRELAVSPMVVMLCGPSGHGKSLLARKFGSLLEVPTHTVNMTTLRSTHNLWESHSMSPYETPTACTLAEFLTNNEGKRCVVVLDEIEKTEDPKTLWSLLMPWELGRCAFEAGTRHVDVKNVIWLGTSNVGHELVFKHRDKRKNTEELMSREEYVELMALLRPKVSERLGASVLSRITTVLPFVPFTTEERRAICSEALYTLGGELARTLSPETVQTVIDDAMSTYCEEEGARSLHRAISNKLVDII